MGRLRGSSNVSISEAAHIRRLFRAGVRLVDIQKAVKRGESTIVRVVRGLTRRKPARRVGRHAERNDRVLALVEKGHSHAHVAKMFKLTPRLVGLIVAAHPRIGNLLRRGVRFSAVSQRFRLALSTVQRIAKLTK